LLQTNLHVSPYALNVEKFHEIRKQFHSEVLCFSPVLTVICGRLEKDRERTLLLVSSQVLHTGDPAQFDKGHIRYPDFKQKKLRRQSGSTAI